MQGKYYLAGILSLLCCEISYSIQLNDGDSLNRIHLNQVFSSVSIGAEWISTGGSQTLILLPPIPNDYLSQNTFKPAGSLSMGIGVEHHSLQTVFWQLGIAGYFDSAITKKGYVEQFSLPEFTNFTYNYQVQSYRAVATGKVLSTLHSIFHPFISGELGAAFNRAINYYEMPLTEEAIPMAPFRDHSQTSFAWGVGTGVEVDVNPHLRLGAAYQFNDIGKAKLGQSPVQATHQTLSIPNLYSHQLRIQLTAFI